MREVYVLTLGFVCFAFYPGQAVPHLVGRVKCVVGTRRNAGVVFSVAAVGKRLMPVQECMGLVPTCLPKEKSLPIKHGTGSLGGLN